jgi:hypothetical protein
MALPTHNAFKDVGHIVKFNGENYSDYRCEFLSMMEQLGMKTMVDAPEGRVETLPTEVIIVYFLTFYHCFALRIARKFFLLVLVCLVFQHSNA